MKKFICICQINNKTYFIFDVDKIQGKLTYVGETNYETATVFIEKGEMEDMIKTLVHELMHIWLYENGYEKQDGGCFTYEEVCEFAAQGYEFIEEVTESYRWHHEVEK